MNGEITVFFLCKGHISKYFKKGEDRFEKVQYLLIYNIGSCGAAVD
jgi:hypothetical protein